MNEELINIRVWGEWACFTRPEMKVERVSYPVITPSAARGVLEAIFWEPQMYYIIDSIRVVRKGLWSSIRRNEVTSRISIANAKKWMSGTVEVSPIKAGGGAEDGTQRNMLALKDVEYIISAHVNLSELGKKADEKLLKYCNEIKRRASSGKCFHRPSFGMREFAVDFDWEDNAKDALQRRLQEIGYTNNWQEDLGLMLYDMFDWQERGAGFKWLNDSELKNRFSDMKPSEQKKIKKTNYWNAEGSHVKPSAAFFRAYVKDSVMDCHPSRVEMICRSGGYE